jgi:cytochrome c-type biogenesis protein
MGASATLVGSSLVKHRAGLMQAAGVVVIVLGLVSMGLLRIPFLLREVRPGMRMVRSGPAGAFPLGMAFAIGWTPCIGPVLGGILTAAAATAAPVQGAALLFTYSLGLGIPFLLLAVGVGRSARLLEWLRRRGREIEMVGGMLLIAIGILMITGLWLRLFIPALRLFSRTGWPPI